MAQEREDPKCPECGHSIYSRAHLEGQGDIHVRYEGPTEAVAQFPAIEHDVLQGMTNAELVAVAEERGIEVPQRPTKAQLVALLEA